MDNDELVKTLELKSILKGIEKKKISSEITLNFHLFPKLQLEIASEFYELCNLNIKNTQVKVNNATSEVGSPTVTLRPEQQTPIMTTLSSFGKKTLSQTAAPSIFQQLISTTDQSTVSMQPSFDRAEIANNSTLKIHQPTTTDQFSVTTQLLFEEQTADLSSVTNKSLSKIQQPTSITEQPTVSTLLNFEKETSGQPIAPTNSSSEISQPTYTTEQPTVSTLLNFEKETTGQPIAPTNSSSEISQPTYTTEQPTYTTEQPTVSTLLNFEKETTGQPIAPTNSSSEISQPTYTTEQPTYTTEQPTVSTLLNFEKETAGQPIAPTNSSSEISQSTYTTEQPKLSTLSNFEKQTTDQTEMINDSTSKTHQSTTTEQPAVTTQSIFKPSKNQQPYSATEQPISTPLFNQLISTTNPSHKYATNENLLSNIQINTLSNEIIAARSEQSMSSALNIKNQTMVPNTLRTIFTKSQNNTEANLQNNAVNYSGDAANTQSAFYLFFIVFIGNLIMQSYLV